MHKTSQRRATEKARRDHARGGGWQDPNVRHIMQHVDLDSEAMAEVLRELMYLKIVLGAEITPTVLDRVIVRAKQHEARMAQVRVEEDRKACIPDTSVVYYMRIGNRCKIGTSTNLRGRLEAINPEELLAHEPGGPADERARHRQFAALRTHGEWFRYEGPLVEHVESIRRQE